MFQGLVTEASTPQKLLEKIKVMIPELLQCSEELRASFAEPEVPIFLMAEQVSRVRTRA